MFNSILDDLNFSLIQKYHWIEKNISSVINVILGCSLEIFYILNY